MNLFFLSYRILHSTLYLFQYQIKRSQQYLLVTRTQIKSKYSDIRFFSSFYSNLVIRVFHFFLIHSFLFSAVQLGMVPIVLYYNSIAILWYVKFSKYCNTYCKISKYCNIYYKFFQVFQKVLQRVLQKVVKFQSIAKSMIFFKLCYFLLNFDW